MSGDAKILQKRFSKIRSKQSRKSKITAAVMAAALAMTVLFATVAMAAIDGMSDNENYVVKWSNNAVSTEEFEFQNKAFIENGEVYMPLRELFYIVGAVSNNNDGSYIKWDNGKIDLCIAYNDDSHSKNADIAQMGTNFTIEIGNQKIRIAPDVTPDGFQLMNNTPVLRKGITYIPYSYINYMLNSIDQWHINYSVYDKNENLINSSFGPISDKEAMLNIENYEDKTMACYNLTEKFFTAFENGDMNTMKQCGTDKFGRYYFHGDKFLSMKSGELATVYSIRIFTDGRYYVHLRMKSDDLEEAEPDKKGVFFAILEERDDGEFLISEFQPSDKGKWEDTNNNLKVGTIMVDENNTIVYKGENLINPESTINSFFEAFSDGDFALMKNYCTENGRNTFFGDGYCFGMTRAELTEMDIVDDSRFDFVAFVEVNMTPHERSVFDSSQTSTAFYLILEKQNDGSYLIDEFATGL